MNGYFDVNEILAEEEDIVVQTRVPLYGMGWLRTAGGCEEQEHNQGGLDDESDGEEGKDLAKDQTVKVPLWLARPLLRERQCKVSFPAFFDSAFLEKLRSHPFAVSLAKEATEYYYEFAHLLALSLPAGSENQVKLKEVAMDVFISRMPEILLAAHLQGHDAEETKSKLTNLERQLLQSAKDEMTAKRKWANTGTNLHRFAPYSADDIPHYLRHNENEDD
eukprot:TRINITY_DN3995_c0_g1_i1.p1 TRINITY_DN3995_c0_g1~~TRINITY_DN3995_c0_g1_i1.p1  ORF type:complete len:220 (+),score=37.78 TRINITY_DN3995_c0_g1_i1:34-693(+)